ncbi:MAG: septum formation initiator family protein [Acetatifactor sp.]|nr:septum formation initiator family protein [Acetatifactor sp.]
MRNDRRDKKTTKKNRKNLLLVAGVVLVLCVVMSVGKVRLEEKSAACEQRLEELEKDLSKEEKRADEIEDYKSYVQTKKFIEEEARDKLGLVYPDEIIFEAEE